jgi:hypothetical protein
MSCEAAKLEAMGFRGPLQAMNDGRQCGDNTRELGLTDGFVTAEL